MFAFFIVQQSVCHFSPLESDPSVSVGSSIIFSDVDAVDKELNSAVCAVSPGPRAES